MFDDRNPQRLHAKHRPPADEDMSPICMATCRMSYEAHRWFARKDKVLEINNMLKRNSLSGKFRPARMA